jgi:hypothetical protein
MYQLYINIDIISTNCNILISIKILERMFGVIYLGYNDKKGVEHNEQCIINRKFN